MLFVSFVHTPERVGCIEAMILGGTLSQQLPADAASGYVLFPLAIHATLGFFLQTTFGEGRWDLGTAENQPCI